MVITDGFAHEVWPSATAAVYFYVWWGRWLMRKMSTKSPSFDDCKRFSMNHYRAACRR